MLKLPLLDKVEESRRGLGRHEVFEAPSLSLGQIGFPLVPRSFFLPFSPRSYTISPFTPLWETVDAGSVELGIESTRYEFTKKEIPIYSAFCSQK